MSALVTKSAVVVYVHIGDALKRLRAMPSKSVHCIITSPPYWGLRDYGVEGQLGLELTPEQYVAVMVEVFMECHRVLRDDGTLWLNLGDSYASNAGGYDSMGSRGATSCGRISAKTMSAVVQNRARVPASGLKPKDLVGMPWRVAFALQATGWYLRSDIIWDKPNTMPESVYDRPTNSHEYVFLFSKSERYFYDRYAIMEPVSGTANARGNGVTPKAKACGPNGRAFKDRDPAHPRPKANVSFSLAVSGLVAERNKRNVWRIASQPYKGAHYATFPPALVEPCLLAGTSAHGVCSVCGTPYRRRVKKGEPNREHQLACGGNADGEYHGTATKDYATARAQDPSATKARILAGMRKTETVGWDQWCHCLLSKAVAATVLDPFAGSGTVGQVARAHGRASILIDLNPNNLPLIQGRVGEVQLC